MKEHEAASFSLIASLGGKADITQLTFHCLQAGNATTTLWYIISATTVVADIVGHEKMTMTYGLYSGGLSLAVKKEALELLAYR